MHSPAECHPVSCNVDIIESADDNTDNTDNTSKPGKMAVTAPVDQINLPGLTKDKWAHKKAAEADAERRNTQYDFPSLIMPGYIQDCATVYGVNITPGLRLLSVTLVVWFAIFLTANTIAYFVG